MNKFPKKSLDNKRTQMAKENAIKHLLAKIFE